MTKIGLICNTFGLPYINAQKTNVALNGKNMLKMLTTFASCLT